MAGTQNITADFRERQFAAYNDQSVPPSWFRHKVATYTGPTAIVFPGTLNMLERAEVNAWLWADVSLRPVMLSRCTQRAAIAKITEYIAYYADASYLAWKDTDEAARLAQWKLFSADALIQSKATVSSSGDVTGTGSSPTSAPIALASNTPD